MDYEDPVLKFIRDNITLERIAHVERLIQSFSMEDLLDLEKYFNSSLTESCYRAHKGSYKIDSSKTRGLTFLGLILHVLFGDLGFDLNLVFDSSIERKINKALRRHFEGDSYFVQYSQRFLNTKTGRKTKIGWIDISEAVFPLLGAEIFFYCTLSALIEICKKALTDEKYKFPQLINWKEGITIYLIGEAIGKRALFKSAGSCMKLREEKDCL